MRRKAHGNEFRSNFHLGGSVSGIELTPRQKEIAVQASETLGLDIAGVDLLESERGPLVLEVNSSPGLEGIEGATRVNVAGKVAEHLNARLEIVGEEQESGQSENPGSESGEFSSAY